MTRPVYNPAPIGSGLEGWDGEANDNFAQVGEVFQDGPVPLKEYAVGTLPPANEFDRCAAIYDDPTAGWCIVISDGSAWKIVGKQAAAQADSVAATVVDLRTDFNALLAKLRASGVIAP